MRSHRMLRSPPTHPGEMFLEEFLEPLALSQRDVAEALGISYIRLNKIINRRAGSLRIRPSV